MHSFECKQNLNDSFHVLVICHSENEQRLLAASPAGYAIPKGQWLLVPIYAIHRDPAVWGDDADKFAPERWVGLDGEARAGQQQGFMPFGAGPRHCPGARFALQEAKLVLYHIFCCFTLEASEVRRSQTGNLKNLFALLIACVLKLESSFGTGF